MRKVGIIMGSLSDFDVVKPAIDVLKQFDIEVEARALSAHRTPNEVKAFAEGAVARGLEVIISAAGKAAHLGGVVASLTPLPVIGLPVKSSTMDGLDSLLSTVQMPNGVPVATVAINGGQNAGLLAVQILALKYDDIMTKLIQYKSDMAKKVVSDDEKLQEMIKLW